jgi:PAS domain S-box-containing protein
VKALSADSLAGGWTKALSIDPKQFNMFFERMMDGFAYHKIVLGKTGKPIDYVFLEVNHAFEALTGLNREEIIGKKVTEVFKGIKNDPTDWIGVYGRVALTGEPVEFENFAAPLGKWYKISAYCPEKGYFVAMFEDITERKKSVEALARKQDELETIFDSSRSWIFYKDKQNRFLHVNKPFAAIMQMSKEQLEGRSLFEVYPKEQAEKFWKDDQQVIESGTPKIGIIEQMQSSKGPLWVQTDKIPYRDPEGNIIGVIGFAVDITERKLMEDALKESEQRWATTVSSIGDAVITTDLSGKVTFLNSVAEALTGWNLAEAKQKPLTEVFRIINEQSLLEVENLVVRVLKEGAIVGLANHTILIRKDGTTVPIDDSGAPIKEKDGTITGVVLIFRDISERKKKEEKIALQAFMIANANDAIIGYDLAYKVTFWNKSAEQLYGYKAEEALGKESAELLQPTYTNLKREELIDKISRVGHVETESFRRRKDGCSVNIEAHVILLRNEVGNPIGYVSVDRDSTERKKAEEALKRMNEALEERVRKRTADVTAERQRLYNVLETLPAYVVLLDKDYGVQFANKVFRERFGESKGRPCYDFLFHRNTPCENCETYKVLKTMGPHRWEWTGPDGRDYDIYDFPFPEADGATLILEMGIDITERKKAEKQVQADSLYARSLIEASLDPLVTISANGKITDVNKATEKATGYSRQELIGSDFSEYFTEPDKARAGYTKVFNEGYVIDYPLALKDKSGKLKDVLYNAAVYRNAQGEIQGVFAAARDITERKRAEAELKKYREHLEELVEERTAQLQDSEQRFAKAFHSSPAAMTIARLPEGIWVDVNDSFLKMTEYSRGEIVGHTSSELGMFEGDLSERVKLIEDLRRHRSVSNVELGAVTKSGKPLRLLFSGVLVNLNGQDHIIAMQTDITERKKSEEAIKKQAQLINLSPDGIIVRKADGTITFWSKGAERLYGWTSAEAIGESTHKILHTKFPQPLNNILQKLHETKFWTGELIHQTKDKKQLTIQSFWSAEFDAFGNIAEVFESNVDITERARLQEKLEESAVQLEEYASQMEQLAKERLDKLKDAERLATIGATAGMVGHDIRNPLQSILSELYLAKSELPALANQEAKANLTESIANIENDITYINKIVQDLQDFAKPLRPVAKPVDLEEICRELLKRANVPKNIKTAFQIQANAERIVTDPDMLKRVIANLVTNAAQAMPEGGKLTLRAYREGGSVLITVQDTGVGIPEEVRPKLFSPLFTTKSKGQGFGLAVAKRTTEALDGTVTFESDVGKGTTFIISLPVHKNAEA